MFLNGGIIKKMNSPIKMETTESVHQCLLASILENKFHFVRPDIRRIATIPVAASTIKILNDCSIPPILILLQFL